jgi:hypothetical protein
MHRHDVIRIEEPPAGRLQEMLQGDLSIDDDLWSAEVEYSQRTRLYWHSQIAAFGGL